jgi:hypothetical protein
MNSTMIYCKKFCKCHNLSTLQQFKRAKKNWKDNAIKKRNEKKHEKKKKEKMADYW